MARSSRPQLLPLLSLLFYSSLGVYRRDEVFETVERDYEDDNDNDGTHAGERQKRLLFMFSCFTHARGKYALDSFTNCV